MDQQEKERLKEMYLDKSIKVSKIKEEFGLDDTLLYEILDEMEVPRRREQFDRRSLFDLSSEEKKEIIKWYKEELGTTVKEIAEMYNISDENLYTVVREAGIKGRGNGKMTDEEKEKIKKEYLYSPDSINQISKRSDRSYTTIRRVVNEIPECRRIYKDKYKGLQPEEMKNLIYWHFKNNTPLSKLEKKFKHTESLLRVVLDNLGLPSLRNFTYDKIKKMHLDGEDIYTIIQEVKFQESTVKRIIDEMDENYQVKYLDLMEQITSKDNIEVPQIPTPEGGEEMVVPDPETEAKNDQIITPEDTDEPQLEEDKLPVKKFFGKELIITGDFTLKTSVSEDEYKNSGLKVIIK